MPEELIFPDNAERRLRPWLGTNNASCLGHGDSQNCLAGNTLTYDFQYKAYDVGQFGLPDASLAFKQEGMYWISVNVKLIWVSPPTTGGVQADIRYGGSGWIDSWRGDVVGRTDTYFSLNGAVYAEKDTWIDVYFDNWTDEDVGVTARIAIMRLT